jgi:hypothetical protein
MTGWLITLLLSRIGIKIWHLRYNDLNASFQVGRFHACAAGQDVDASPDALNPEGPETGATLIQNRVWIGAGMQAASIVTGEGAGSNSMS